MSDDSNRQRDNHRHIVEELLACERERRERTPFSDEQELLVDDAYAIQDALVARKLASGDVLAGMKLGLTSKAKQRTMNIDEPCYGQLLASTQLPPGGPFDVGSCIHPRVEPEIVFRLGVALAGPGVRAEDVLAATGSVSCGLEVIDSRYRAFRFTLPDVVADNTSAARFVLGDTQVSPAEVPDLALIGCVLRVDGEVVDTAAGAAVLGDPAASVALLANWLGARGRRLEPGWLVLSGGLTNAVPVAAGSEVQASFDRLGTVTLRCV